MANPDVLQKGDRLPPGTFGVYEELSTAGSGEWVLAAVSKYAYPPVNLETQRMTILAPGESVDTNRPTLYVGPPTKPAKIENAGRWFGFRYNGVRVPFWVGAMMLNEIGTK